MDFQSFFIFFYQYSKQKCSQYLHECKTRRILRWKHSFKSAPAFWIFATDVKAFCMFSGSDYECISSTCVPNPACEVPNTYLLYSSMSSFVAVFYTTPSMFHYAGRLYFASFVFEVENENLEKKIVMFPNWLTTGYYLYQNSTAKFENPVCA